MATLERQSGLPVDRLLITAGINELHWASIVERCSPPNLVGTQLRCLKGVQPLLDKATASS